MARRNFEPPRAVLCGSYTRDREGLFRAYDELIATGCQVLSPRRMQFDNAAFVRDTAEQGISPQAIEAWHLSAICQADFVMLHAPDGYVGLSAAMEIGPRLSGFFTHCTARHRRARTSASCAKCV